MHIPFCRQACAYCNFHFTTSLRYKDELVAALKKEILLEKDFFNGAPVSTIYFGGGTPSLLEEKEVSSILELIYKVFKVEENPEITLEANPDDISNSRLQGWKNAGINRLSIGIQSFFDSELRWMNRAHNAEHARNCIELSLDNGFTNLTADLIYGSPLLSDEMWEENVATLTAYPINHLSCYALTVEEKTPLHKKVLQAVVPDVENDKQARQFLLLMKWMKQKGFEHYEVSNFARPGYRSRHNSSYWKGLPYLGIGPSAHSFNGTIRRWNIANNNSYTRNMAAGLPEREEELLTAANRLNEMIMISLRTMEGLSLDRVEQEFGKRERERIEKEMQPYISQGRMECSNGNCRLTEEGMLSADGIAASLFR